ncbi:MAG: glycerate kinase type-2 family protein [Pyrinomonadaceae bacterium]
MTGLVELRRVAREIYQHALRAVDPRKALRSAVNLDAPLLRICDTVFDTSARPIHIVAIGKAAPAMAITLDDILDHTVTGGVVSAPDCPELHALESGRWRVFAGGHPLPNQASLDAAQAAFDLLRRAERERALVVFLISGGGSAMIEWPRDGRITLADLREANRQLVSCGASITEINAVRRALSAVKGGRLGERTPNTEQITLIISDTNRGDEASVASGPTVRPHVNSPRSMDVVERYRHRLFLPSSVLRAIQEAEIDKGHSDIPAGKHYVLLDNQSAIEAAAAEARQLGFAVEVAYDINEQPIEEGSTLLVSRVRALWEQAGREQKRVCLISGGEFSCPVGGTGVGGRNLETVLRCAIEFDKRQHLEDFASSHLVALSGGTDGIDGNSHAAGAIADESTIARGLSRGLHPESFLENSDSFTFFNALGDAIVTGPTGTNVRDLRILIAGS